MSNTKDIGAQVRAQGGIDVFIQAGLDSEGFTDAYILADKLDRKIAAGEVLSDTEIGKLVELVTNDAKAYRQAEIESQQKQEKQAQFRGKASRFFSHGTETETTAPVNIPADGKNEMNYITRTDGVWHTSETGPPSAFRRDSAKTAVAEAPRVGYNVRQTETTGMLSLDDAARGLGKNGARALSTYYNDGLRPNTDTATHPAAYANEFLRYYEAGKQGTSQNSIIPSGGDPLTPAQKAAAYNAGMNDAAAGRDTGIGGNEGRYSNRGTDGAGNKEKSVADVIIRDGSQLENGMLKPNVIYQSGEYDYIYKTNEYGLITNARTDSLQIKNHNGRLNHNPNTYGKVEGDQAGHLFGDRFGGSPELDNLVSQAKRVNQSEFKVLENHWASTLKNGHQVAVDITINYANGGLRPVSFDVSYTLDGVPFFSTISN